MLKVPVWWDLVRPCTRSVEGVPKPVRIGILPRKINRPIPSHTFLPPRRPIIQCLAVGPPLGVAPMVRPPPLLVLARPEVIHHVELHVPNPTRLFFAAVEIPQIVELAPVRPLRSVRRRRKPVADVYVWAFAREEVLHPPGSEVRPFALLFLVARPYPG